MRENHQLMTRSHRGRTARESGLTLIETMIAIVVLLIGILASTGAFLIGINQSKKSGDDGTRTTEYSEDKIEQLMALTFNNLAAGNGSDYVDGNGNISNSSAGAVYTRTWSIVQNAAGNLKTITVTTTSAVVGAPSATLVCAKSNM